MQNINIDHKTLASHFKKTNEAMRQLKRKYETKKTGLWIVYVKAYNFDTKLKEKDFYKLGVIAGFKESGEGYNWEYPFCDGVKDSEEFDKMIDEICERRKEK